MTNPRPVPRPETCRGQEPCRPLWASTPDWDNVVVRLPRRVRSQAPGTGLPDRHTCWLATVNGTAVHMLRESGRRGSTTPSGSRPVNTLGKGGLARDPRCSLSLATHEFDLVVEGIAEQIRDPATVASMAQEWSVQGWPARVDESGIALTADFSAPSAGRPPWVIYRLVLGRATTIQTVAPGGATQWTLDRTEGSRCQRLSHMPPEHRDRVAVRAIRACGQPARLHGEALLDRGRHRPSPSVDTPTGGRPVGSSAARRHPERWDGGAGWPRWSVWRSLRLIEEPPQEQDAGADGHGQADHEARRRPIRSPSLELVGMNAARHQRI